MKKITLLGVMAFLCMYLAAQEKPIKPLTIGGTIPDDLVLTNVYNYPVSKIRLSDLKGKLVILDFWATWCGSCLHNFALLDSLQNIEPTKLQILMVNSIQGTGDNIPKIQSFLQKWKTRNGTGLTLPVISEDTTLKNMFPHTFIPHYVWLSGNGTVLAITSSEEVSIENIKTAIDGNDLNLPIKNDSRTTTP